jgi:hypothetical protein
LRATPGSSPSATGGISATPSLSTTVQATLLVSPTISPTTSSTAPPYFSPTTLPTPVTMITGYPSASPNSDTTGALEILQFVPIPNPSPNQLKIDIQGSCESLTIKIYTCAMVRASQATFSGAPTGWSTLPLSPLLEGLPPGLYFAWAGVQGVAGMRTLATARFVLLP